MFGTNAVSDWKEGSPIVWKGEWMGKKYEDRGVILKLEPGNMIQYSHFSPLTGQPDLPENYQHRGLLSYQGRENRHTFLFYRTTMQPKKPVSTLKRTGI